MFSVISFLRKIKCCTIESPIIGIIEIGEERTIIYVITDGGVQIRTTYLQHPFEFFPMRLYQKEISDPYGVFAQFFLDWYLPQCRKWITSMSSVAYGYDYWKKEPAW